jgi:hypothetical protein
MAITEEEIEVLKSIVDSNPVAISFKRPWWSFRIRIKNRIYPKLEEQLDALSELGKSKNPNVLKYLEKLSYEESWYESYDSSNSCGDCGGSCFPYTNGELYFVLISSFKNPLCSNPITEKKRNERAYSVLINALSQLRKDLAPSNE